MFVCVFVWVGVPSVHYKHKHPHTPPLTHPHTCTACLENRNKAATIEAGRACMWVGEWVGRWVFVFVFVIYIFMCTFLHVFVCVCVCKCITPSLKLHATLTHSPHSLGPHNQHIYTDISIHVCTYFHVHTHHTHIHTHTLIHTHTHTYTHTHIHTHTPDTHTYAHAHTHTHTHTHTNTHTRAHTNTRDIHMYTHTQTHIQIDTRRRYILRVCVVYAVCAITEETKPWRRGLLLQHTHTHTH